MCAQNNAVSRTLTEALSEQNGLRLKSPLVAFADEKTLPLIQQFARNHAPYGDDVRLLSAVAAPDRGPAIRTWYRYLPRDSSVLVEPVRPDVRRGDPWKMRYWCERQNV